VVAYAEGAVVRRTVLAPGVHERCRRQSEPEAAVSVPDTHRRSRQRLAYGREHLEVAFAGLGYAEDGDGSCLDSELDGDAVAGFAVVDTEALSTGFLSLMAVCPGPSCPMRIKLSSKSMA
jgi:hypothetical protein